MYNKYIKIIGSILINFHTYDVLFIFLYILYLLTVIYLFIFFNTTYISFDYDILLEFFTHMDCVQPNSRGQDMSYHSLSGTISIPRDCIHPIWACLPRYFRSSCCLIHSVCCIYRFHYIHIHFGIYFVHGPFKSIFLNNVIIYLL